MKTFEYTFTVPSSDIQHDMLTTMLAEIGFDSFMDEDYALKAYCSTDSRDDMAVENLLLDPAFTDLRLLKVEEMPDKDWNELWEASYQPVVVNERCRVRAPFHEPDPSFEFDLVIEPKMSFGTANHETTAQIIQLMLETDFQGKEVLDMGSGTAVLAILAKKLGAVHTVAIDNDEWAYRNAFTNVDLNGVSDIDIILGDALSIQGQYDVVLANINRNILLRDMHYYVEAMKPGAHIFFSGFYTEDLESIKVEAERLGLHYERHLTRNNWVAAEFVK
ncbi:MAG: 50S ribosomal protein L11 methyltransferase [Bacteroidales bacterium]|nr:50S ribosomal protein L11 methyltransferase [Bacteroidales bacterium]MBR6227764.1 50S ribosomal protein L11 methyltransferase [Bacteroidales bacterium]